MTVVFSSGLAGTSTLGPAASAASSAAAPTDACRNPTVPDWFHDSLVTAIKISGVATTSPLGSCPVAGSVSYSDDFGQPRNVGGYHPHWGNDIRAPLGQEVRAPFDGLAVARSDNWFAGNFVTVVGLHGYVRNDHLDRFGTLGYVTAGTVIGYVGATG